MTWIIFFALALLYWLIATFVLSGPDLSQYDEDVGERFASHRDDSAANDSTLKTITDVRQLVKRGRSPRNAFKVVRDFADNLSDDLVTDTQFTTVQANGVDCEWAVATNADPKRRILFMHGGAFLLGSAKGHRKFCDQLSKLANAAVLSVNYRMLPESGRKAGIIDTQNAYQWILNNGPDGETALDFLLIAGDSAGGNLAMMISGWSKENAPRKPDAVIAFSPSLDMTMQSPTIKQNRLTDKILGEGLGLITKLPMFIRAWTGLFAMRMNPSNPLASPVFGDLSDLPPTLIHASSSEMLLGDSIRYTNKAKAAGSDVALQIWDDQIHDWHLFNMGYGSANQAWSEINQFIDNLQPNKTRT